MSRPATSVEVMPSGIEIEYWDSVGIEDGLPQQRRYAVAGKRTASVSTIAKYIDPSVDGLLYWASGLTCEGVSQLAVKGGDLAWLNSGQSIQGALRDAELTWTDIRDQAAKRGTAVHELVFAALAERHKMPDLAALTEEERGFGRAAYRWWNDVKPKPILTEQMVASQDLGFAGRFDLLCEIDGERVLVDAKTRGRPTDRPSDHIQLAGYRVAIQESGFGDVDRTAALILTGDGEYEEVTGQAEDADFLAALSVYRAKSELGKRMRKARKAVAA